MINIIETAQVLDLGKMWIVTFNKYNRMTMYKKKEKPAQKKWKPSPIKRIEVFWTYVISPSAFKHKPPKYTES